LCTGIVLGMIVIVIPMVKGNAMVKIKRIRPLELEVEWDPQADTRSTTGALNIPTTHSRVQPCRSYAFITEHVSLENASTHNIHVCLTTSKTPKCEFFFAQRSLVTGAYGHYGYSEHVYDVELLSFLISFRVGITPPMVVHPTENSLLFTEETFFRECALVLCLSLVCMLIFVQTLCALVCECACVCECFRGGKVTA